MSEDANQNPLVSVVIPTYNHAHFLGRALQSVLNQTYTNWEAIVIDNHSTDNTDEVMLKFADPRIKFIKIHNNGVIAASRNVGIRTAKGEWIAFLDSDDWWAADKLLTCFQRISSTVDFVYHDLKIVRSHPSLFGRRKLKSRTLNTPVLIDLLVNGNGIANSSVLVKKELLNKIGGLCEDKEMVACEDYLAWLKIAQITQNFLYVKKNLGFYQIHEQSISMRNMSIPERRIISGFNSLLNRVEKLRIESRFLYINARHAYKNGDFIATRADFLFCVKHGVFDLRLKSAFIIMLIYIKSGIIHTWQK